MKPLVFVNAIALELKRLILKYEHDYCLTRLFLGDMQHGFNSAVAG